MARTTRPKNSGSAALVVDNLSLSGQHHITAVIQLTNEQLVLEYQMGNHAALEVLMNENKGIVYTMARKYFSIGERLGMTFEDILQESYIGFMVSAKEYKADNDSNATFAAYAFRRIRWVIFRTFYKNTPRKAKSDPSSDRIHITSLDEPIPGTDDMIELDNLVDPQSEDQFLEVEERLYTEQLRQDILLMLNEVFVTDIRKNVLVLHFGICCKPKTLEELAEHLGYSVEYIRTLEKNAFKAIREHPAGKRFMSTYKWDIICGLDSINIVQRSSPEGVVSQLDYVEQKISRLLNICLA